ncbi:MAG: precorrin-6A reductase [Salinivirgaceae bacterium]|jgi:precorrin-6A/cobalt-precorrin-6A reductase|nr:precorrin-6A reductase [Salinivirgaceae bacterium]
MIWLIGGTSDAHKIADLVLAENKKVLVSTTTSYGAVLAQKANVKVIQDKLEIKDMKSILRDYSIETVIDASHPFANLVSQNAIAACKEAGTKYIRFERECAEIEKVDYYNSYAQIIDALEQTKGNILLTIGSKNIHQFNKLKSDRIIARVLPVKESIELCMTAGLKAHQIIAMKGRMSMETNKALLLEYDIKHLITKDSGEAGGLYEKVDAAKMLSVKVYVLKRPEISYPVLYNNYTSLIQNI